MDTVDRSDMIQYVTPNLRLTQKHAFIKKFTIHIFTNFRNDFVKIVDFLIKAYSWVSLKFGVTYCSLEGYSIDKVSKS